MPLMQWPGEPAVGRVCILGYSIIIGDYYTSCFFKISIFLFLKIKIFNEMSSTEWFLHTENWPIFQGTEFLITVKASTEFYCKSKNGMHTCTWVFHHYNTQCFFSSSRFQFIQDVWNIPTYWELAYLSRPNSQLAIHFNERIPLLVLKFALGPFSQQQSHHNE